MPRGYWCPVLHAHLPWVRDPDAPGLLEEDWLYEAITECYLPLVDVLDRLREDGVGFRLTLNLSPTLLSMLSDPLLIGRCERRLDGLIELAAREAARTRRGRSRFAAAAAWYAAELPRLAGVFRQRWRSDLVAAFRHHRDAGGLELIGCAATHAFLPLLEPVPEAVRAQIAVGCGEHARLLGRSPRGFWLPECGYAPVVERPLRAAGIDYAFLESHGLEHGDPRPRRGVLAPVVSPGGVAFFGRDAASSRQVWSATEGYPGDPVYREFYRDAGWELPRRALGGLLPDGERRNVGLKYHRVTGAVPLGEKQPWQPEAALARAREHAAHYVAERGRQVSAGRGRAAAPPLVVSAFDAELFGHWWFEGPAFLEAVFRALARQAAVRAVTPGEYLERHPECDVVQPARSSWGDRGHAAVWLDRSNDWVHAPLDAGARRMVALARAHPRARGRRRRALRQAARELLLAQASDWSFMMRMGAAAAYAERRVREHLARLARLHAAADHAPLEEVAMSTLERTGAIFPELDYRVYA